MRKRYKQASSSFKFPGGFYNNIYILNSKGKKFVGIPLIEEIPVNYTHYIIP